MNWSKQTFKDLKGYDRQYVLKRALQKVNSKLLELLSYGEILSKIYIKNSELRTWFVVDNEPNKPAVILKVNLNEITTQYINDSMSGKL